MIIKQRLKLKAEKGVFMLRLGLSYGFVMLNLKYFFFLQDKSGIFFHICWNIALLKYFKKKNNQNPMEDNWTLRTKVTFASLFFYFLSIYLGLEMFLKNHRESWNIVP